MRVGYRGLELKKKTGLCKSVGSGNRNKQLLSVLLAAIYFSNTDIKLIDLILCSEPANN